MGPRRRLPARAAALLGLIGASCIASNVVAPEDRMVRGDVAAIAFAPAPELVLRGLFESVDVRGEAASSLRKVYYLFQPDGTYTAAALTESDGAWAFQTLGGTWQNGGAGLVLDGGPPVQLEAADDHIRLTAPTGVVVMARRRLQ